VNDNVRGVKTGQAGFARNFGVAGQGLVTLGGWSDRVNAGRRRRPAARSPISHNCPKGT